MDLETPHDDLAYLGRKALMSHTEAILQETEGVIAAEDPEHIHRMRVGIRRFRSVQDSIPGIAAETVPSRWSRVLKQTGRRLGSARDLDVQREAIDAYAEANGCDKDPGIDRLKLRIGQKRARLQSRVASTVRNLEESGRREGMLQMLRQDVARHKLSGEDQVSESGRTQARAIIVDRMTQLLAFDACVKDETREGELHEMRIAAKRLRYTMEAFQPVYKKTIKNTLGIVKEIQSLLGDIHDSDVWIAFLPQFVAKEEKRTFKFLGHKRGFGRIARGIETFRENRESFRAVRLAEFRELWTRLRKDDFWTTLYRDLESAPEITSLERPALHAVDQLDRVAASAGLGIAA